MAKCMLNATARESNAFCIHFLLSLILPKKQPLINSPFLLCTPIVKILVEWIQLQALLKSDTDYIQAWSVM